MNDERRRKETDGKETPKPATEKDKARPVWHSSIYMYLHLYEFLAAPPPVVRLQYWRGYKDRSVEKSREQYTSVISR